MSYNYYSEEEFEAELSKKPGVGAFLAVLGSIPGSVLWLILAYYTPFASIMALLISLGAILGFRIGAKYMSYSVKNKIIIYGTVLMFILTSGVTSYTLYKQYNEDVLKQSTIDELRESFITSLHNNGKSTEETEEMLRNQYGINGFNDIDGLNNLVKETLADTYKDSHRVDSVPDTPTNAVICLYQSLAYNRTIAKPFFFNILGGFFLCMIAVNGLIRLSYFKPNDA